MASARRLNVRGFPTSVHVPALVLALMLAATSALAAAPAKTITVGTLTLKSCDATFNGYCGSIQRPLDPTGGVKGNINIAFVYYPRFDETRPALGTLLPQQRSEIRRSGARDRR